MSFWDNPVGFWAASRHGCVFPGHGVVRRPLQYESCPPSPPKRCPNGAQWFYWTLLQGTYSFHLPNKTVDRVAPVIARAKSTFPIDRVLDRPKTRVINVVTYVGEINWLWDKFDKSSGTVVWENVGSRNSGWPNSLLIISHYDGW